MELEELKASWNVLNERLRQSEILDKRIVKEMILKRSDDAIGRLYKLDVLGAVVCVVTFLALLVAAIVYPYIGTVWGRFALAALPGVASVWGMIKLRLIGRIDPRECSLKEVSSLLAKYKIWNIRELLASIPAAFVTLAFVFSTMPVFPWQGLVVCVVSGLIVGSLEYIYYKRSVVKVDKILQELQEFEEEGESE